jgi:mono/diheme cytochrome c family protein
MKRTAAAISFIVSLTMLAGCGGGGDGADSGKKPAAPTVDANTFAKAKGKVIYNKTCIACHGEGGLGVENLGKNWTTSEFIANSSDEELLAFIRAGRTIDDPKSAGNAPMPPSGGDPTLTDADLNNVIVYMRSLQD